MSYIFTNDFRLYMIDLFGYCLVIMYVTLKTLQQETFKIEMKGTDTVSHAIVLTYILILLVAGLRGLHFATVFSIYTV